MPFALSDMTLSSSSFGQHARIPQKHTGEGKDVSPPFSWTNVPDGTRSFALICHDPDAPLVTPAAYGFVHWVIYNIPGSVTDLPEAVDDHTVGMNNFDRQGYGGPMPPEGHGVHHYFFWLMALDDDPGLRPGLTMWELLGRIEPNIIGMNRLVGTYARG